MTDEADGNFAGKHLVILGCGYVGSELARQAIGRGVRVTALTRNPAKAESLRALGADVEVADLAGDAWHGAMPRPDWVVNCVSSGGGGAASYRRSYLDGMKSTVAWASGVGGVEALVYTSSTSVYPQGDGATVDETAPVTGRDERSAVLVETEAILLAAENAARRRVVLRLAGIYGPDRSYLLEQVRSGEVSGVGSHHLNLIHRDDACGAIWAALAGAPAGAGVYNVADDGRATKGEIVAWLAGQIGLPAPHFTGQAMGGRSATPDRIIANDRLKAALGWRPRFGTFRDGYANLLSR